MPVTDPFLLAADLFDPPEDPYAQNPVGWARDILGIHLWSRQRDIVESVRDHRRTAVRSGHGVGKTLTAAAVVLWFLDTHLESRVITTATKWSQVEMLLWHELGQLHARAKKRIEAQERAIFRVDPLKTQLQLPDGRYAIGLSSKPENSESFAGHHAPNILVVYDEASGVHRKIYEVGEGYMTTDGAKSLLIGNPTRTSGVFFDAFHTDRRRVQLPSHLSSRITRHHRRGGPRAGTQSPHRPSVASNPPNGNMATAVRCTKSASKATSPRWERTPSST